MENKELKIKSYLYIQQNLLILFDILSIIIFITCIIICKSINRRIVIIAIMLPLIFLFLFGAFITRFGCRTYDCYNEYGIKRVRKNKIIFFIKWDNIKSAIYFNIGEIIILQPFVLNIDLIKPLESNENRSYDNNESISTPMNKKTIKKIASFSPIEIKNIPK